MKKRFYLIAFAFIAIFNFTVSNSFAQEKQAKYVFYFIGDGMGVNQVNGTEMYMGELDGKLGIMPLCFGQFPVVALVTTYSETNSVTDSAAGGTALATGKKTKNGAIGVDKDDTPIYSVASEAKKAGKKVGITTSVSIDHATPASFFAHQPSRKMYYEIATDLPKADFDFYAGSGFLQPTNKKNTTDENIFTLFDKSGYTVAKGYEDFNQKYSNSDKMILIQKDGAEVSSLPFAIDRKDGDLTLSQITESAIRFLNKGEDNGFFL